MEPSTPVGEAAARRRTFAIIAHPDAGKTTLTEKLLLFGGAIHLAGEVKAKGERRRARSDWMKIEQSRGISVTTSVMTFEYGGCTFNLLDTPGHEDFSEDTYRTLTAVDSAVMVIDAAKGIEPQTLKLFEVCRMRDVPIMTFVNKMDREARDPIEILDEIAEKLALDVAPMNWPIGMGQNFRGVIERSGERVLLLSGEAGPVNEEILERGSPRLAERVPAAQIEDASEALELVDGTLSPFDLQAYREGHLTPVFFGSALKTFGVRALLDGLTAHAPSPRPQPTDARTVEPDEDRLTGFVFKVQANMDPKHRDRVAFMRLCSGRFNRGMKLTMVRNSKQLAVANPIMFFARERELAEEAWPGDIIGIPNHGQLRVGDTLSEGETIRFTGIPNFAPEILMRVRLGDPMRAKHLRKALDDMAEEGVTQVFRPHLGSDWVVGVIGQLQLDVLKTRLEVEYNLPISFEPAPFVTARWCDAEDQRELDRFVQAKKAALAEDGDGNPVYLARNAWDLNRVQDDFPKIRFTSTRERH
ncbi:peptide chain release factor 3 [Geminicoccaceae bacterium 1502E]|nr:peptide chain release factor 3 [Geminicoccaceae bacterium 1502E]